ncbi:hypothetical protein ACFPVY_12635 [Flavobacterium qiangtangense]|uniref:Nuclear transport factor 2 family protein n=1 Tax=Flavobacterium qiangtangense TaxID=1442595 RepID=A0ABW1PPN4_9FLAO
MENLKGFVKEYIEAWSTTDLNTRRNLVKKIYEEKAIFYASEPGDNAVIRTGWDSIFENITEVNSRLVVDNGFSTRDIGYLSNHNVLRVMWEMRTQNGEVAMTGMNFLILHNYKIKYDYIFIS